MATDQEVLSQIQRLMIETVDNGVTWSSGLWTVNEVIGYLNEVQRRFIKNTGVVHKRDTSIAVVAGTKTYTLPADFIFNVRVIFKISGRYIEIPRADSMQADLSLPSWRGTNAVRPQAYTDGDNPTLQIQIMPATTANGSLELVYCYLAAALSNSGVALTVPDEFVPAIMYGTMELMLRKLGRGQDIDRAEYCSIRYQEGEIAAELMLSGFA